MPAPTRTGRATTGRATTNPATQTSLLSIYQAILSEQRVVFEAELAEEKAKAEEEIAEQLAAWKKELARIKEEDNYNFNIAKRNREDELKNELASRVVAVTERETKVKEREVTLGDAEKAIATLQATVDGIPFITTKATENGYTKGFADSAKEAEGNARIKDAETKAEKSILQHKISNLESTIEDLSESVSSLRADLVAANTRVETIANNAVTAASKSNVTIQNPAPTSGR